MQKEEIQGRLDALRASMAAQGLRAFVVRDVSNIAWLTGFTGVFDEERAHTMVVTGTSAAIHTDSRYSTALRQANLAGGSLFTIDDAAGEGPSGFVQRMLGAEDAESTITPFAIEDDITLAEFRALEAKQVAQVAAPVETRGTIRHLRAVKSPAEIALMREAQRITDEAFAHMVGFVQPGMTERDVQLELEDYMAWAGSPKVSFASIVAAGANAAKPHSVPGSAKLEAGRMLLLDFGATWMGYHADMTRCIFLGEPTPFVRRIYDTVVAANEAVQAMLKPGVTGKEAHALAEEVLTKAGFGGKMGHGLGHGVGLDIHEEPNLNMRNDAPLVPGNVVTVEPGIYLPEGMKQQVNIPTSGMMDITLAPAMGVRVEDCGVITEEGFDCFTQTSHDIVII